MRNIGPDQAVIDEIVRRIVAVAAPGRVVLFGSRSRGQARASSDFDLLVVKGGDYHRGELTERIYMALRGVGAAVDVVVAKPEDLDRYGEHPALVFRPALTEGEQVYAA
jgi:predicted nucleotidyltransferase